MRPHLRALADALDKRSAQGNLRSLRPLPPDGSLIDFYSNDYLGVARLAPNNGDIEYKTAHDLRGGSTGSRLLSGNFDAVIALEQELATYFDAPAALVFNSGYTANIGFFQAVPQRGDVILYDALIHASVREGVRLSRADSFSFAHNDLDDLAKKIQKHAPRNVFVAVESLYSMDGDLDRKSVV